MGHRRIGLAAWCAALLSACGGGGDGATGAATTSTPQTASPSQTPTVVAPTLAFATTNEAAALNDVSYSHHAALSFVSVVDQSFYTLHGSGRNSATLNCGTTGSLTVTRRNSTATQVVGAGDDIDATYSNCTTTSGTLNAQFAIHVRAFSSTSSQDQLDASVTIDYRSTGLNNTDFVLSGSENVTVVYGPTGGRYAVSGGSMDVASGQLTISALSVSLEDDYAAGTYKLAMSGTLSDPALGGRFGFNTSTEGLTGSLGRWPTAGTLLLTGANSTSLQVDSTTQTPGSSYNNYAVAQLYGAGNTPLAGAQTLSWDGLLGQADAEPLDPTSYSVPSLTVLELAQAAVTIRAATTDSIAPGASVGMNIVHPPAQFWIRAKSVTGIVRSASDGQFGTAWHVTGVGDVTTVINMSMFEPKVMGAGTYNDTVTVSLCLDLACTQMVGTPVQIAVTYVVTGTSGPIATLSTLSNVLRVEADGMTGTAAPVSTELQLTDAPPYPIYYRTTLPANGAVESASVSSGTSYQTLNLNVAMRAPQALASGTYTGSIRIDACYDTACTRPVTGSPVSMPFTYVVPALKGRDFDLIQLPVSVNALAYDAAANVLYAAISKSSVAGMPQKAILEINPQTGAVVNWLQLTETPLAMALSNDGQTLNILTEDASSQHWLNRTSLATGQVSLRFKLPLLDVADFMGFAPGTSDVWALTDRGCPNTITIYDGIVPRAGVYSRIKPCTGPLWTQWADASTLLVSEDYLTPYALYRFDVTASGVTSPSSTVTLPDNVTLPGPTLLSSNRLYAANGNVFDLGSNAVVSQLKLVTPFSVTQRPETVKGVAAIDAAAGRAYYGFADVAPNYSGTVQGYRLSDASPLSFVRLNASGGGFTGVVRYGTNGLAVSGQAGLYLIQGNFVGP